MRLFTDNLLLWSSSFLLLALLILFSSEYTLAELYAADDDTIESECDLVDAYKIDDEEQVVCTADDYTDDDGGAKSKNITIGYFSKQDSREEKYKKDLLDQLSTYDTIQEKGWPFFYGHTCGKAPLNTLNGSTGAKSSYMDGGQQASVGQWPFMAIILKDMEPLCSGVVVTEYHILTAKHCLHGIWKARLKSTIKVLVGTNINPTGSDGSDRVKGSKTAQLLTAEDAIRPAESLFDVSWIVVKERIQFNEYVQPACYPYGNVGQMALAGPNSRCYTLGSGQMGTDSNPLPAKYFRFMRIIVRFECRNKDGQLRPYYRCFESWHDNNRGSSRPGDSGGPILCWSSYYNRWVIQGVLRGATDSKRTDLLYVSVAGNDNLAALTRYADWPPIPHMRYCDWPPFHESRVCLDVQIICGREPLDSPHDPWLVQIEKVAHPAMRDGGLPCPGALISPHLIITSLNCSQAYYHNSLWDIAPLDSFEVRLGLKYVDINKATSLGNPQAGKRRLRRPIHQTDGGGNYRNHNDRVKIDEIYVMHDKTRALILLRTDMAIHRHSGKAPICWPYIRHKLDWDQCFVTLLVASDHTEDHPVQHIECPFEQTPDEAKADSIICFERKNVPNLGVQGNIFESGAPIHCHDVVNRSTLVGIVKRSHQNYGITTLLIDKDLNMSLWKQEIIRDGKTPIASKVF